VGTKNLPIAAAEAPLKQGDQVRRYEESVVPYIDSTENWLKMMFFFQGIISRLYHHKYMNIPQI
jgi:hypothetical protein